MNDNEKSSPAEMNTSNASLEFPASDVMFKLCYEEYKRKQDLYDKLYERINFVLAFSGGILVVLIKEFDFKLLVNYSDITNPTLYGSLFFCIIFGTGLLLWAIFTLLKALISMKTPSLDTDLKKLRTESKGKVEIILIERLNEIISRQRIANDKKQKYINAAIQRILISMVLFGVYVILKGAFL